MFEAEALDTFRYLANYQIMTSVFKALADPTRRQVLQMLRAGPMGAGALADAFDVSKPTMSAHFAVLAAADLIEAEKSGRAIVYRLKMSVLEEALMGFAQAFGLQVTPESPATTTRRRFKEKP